MKNCLLIFLVLSLLSCKKEKEEPEPVPTPVPAKISFEFDFDETLPRLDNFGQPESVGTGHAAQHPSMKKMSAHYIELAQDQWTQLGQGTIVYRAQETTTGGSNAVDFDAAIKSGEGTKFLTLNLSDVAPGTYRWVRVSVTYQNYDVMMHYNIDTNGVQFSGTAPLSISSFVGFNTYITQHRVKDSLQTVNSNQLQGFWMAEFKGNTGYPAPYDTFWWVDRGNSPGTTVVNPNPDSPIPAGSCVVTGQFATPLVITGSETEDIEIVLAFSINNSFEWEEVNQDGLFEPLAGEQITDMGLRGLHPRKK